MQTPKQFKVELKWHNLTHAYYSIFEDGQECGHVVILVQNMDLFEALFSTRALEAARLSLELPA